MIDPAVISPSETGLVRVFCVTRPIDLGRGDLLTPEEICTALGVDQLQIADVQQMWTDDLAGLPLAEFLRQAYEANEDDITSQQVLIDTLDQELCLLVFVRSSAFIDRPATINLTGLLNLVVRVREPETSVTFEPLPNPDPVAVLEEPPQKKKPSDAAMGGRVATIALVVMGLLVWLMIWVAG